MAFSQFTGTFALVSYAAKIFSESGSDLNPHTSAIVMAALQILGTNCTSIFIEKIGRKWLLLISLGGTVMGLSAMGCYSYLSYIKFDVTSMNWLPVVSLSFVLFISSIGLIPLPYVIISEVLPQKVNFYKYSYL